jgi:sugar-specific transcriptional regulator TrmB
MKNYALNQLDLSDREISIYRALLKSGPASIRDIAARTEINRGTTYDTLKGLANKGIVSYFPKGKRRLFMAEDPERLLSLADKKQQALSSAVEQLQREIVPGLKDLKPEFSPGNVRFYEGDDGVELVLRDILDSASRSEEKRYAVISTKTLREHLYRPFPNFTKQRVALGINVRVIAIGEGGDEAELAERKWLPAGDAKDASYIAIYPPKIALITLASSNFPVVVVIDSSAIATTQQLLFDTLWRFL